jgi:F-type H+-transporting ATPase subunit delta
MKRSPKNIAKAFMDILEPQGLSVISTAIDELGLMSKCVKSLRLSSFFKNPGLTSHQKSEWIKKFSDALGCSDITFKLTVSLLAEGLLPSIGKVVSAMKDQRLIRHNVGEAEVITVKGLTPEQREKAEKLIKKMCGYNTVIMNERINPNIIGGIIINSGDMLYEGTIKRQLKNMLKIVS